MVDDDVRTRPVDRQSPPIGSGRSSRPAEQFRRRAESGIPQRQQVRMAAGHGDHVGGALEQLRVDRPAAVRREVGAVLARPTATASSLAASPATAATPGGADHETRGFQLAEPARRAGRASRTLHSASASGLRQVLPGADEQHLRRRLFRRMASPSLRQP